MALVGCQSFQAKQIELNRPGILCPVGESGGFTVEQPAEWKLSVGAYCPIGHPQEANWEDSLAILYGNVVSTAKVGNPLKESIEKDAELFKKEYPKIQIRNLENTTSRSGQKFEVREFILKAPALYERVAYTEVKGSVVALVLSAKHKEEYESSQKAWKDWVESFQFHEGSVTLKKK